MTVRELFAILDDCQKPRIAIEDEQGPYLVSSCRYDKTRYIEYILDKEIKEIKSKKDDIKIVVGTNDSTESMENTTAQTRIQNGDIVQHFKREMITQHYADRNQYLYKIISMNAYDTNSNKRVVVYEALYNMDDTISHHTVSIGDVFVREYDEFMSEVDRAKYPNIKQKYRFEIVGKSGS